MQELPPEDFRFGNYNANPPFSVHRDVTQLQKWVRDNPILGFCYQPSYRPRPQYVAVMFQVGAGEYWQHVPIYIFERYFRDGY